MTKTYSDEITENGIHWFPTPFGPAREVMPGEKNPRGTGIGIPHPDKKKRKMGFRIAILGVILAFPLVIMWVNLNLHLTNVN
jgi:hypothetical protein